MREELAGIMVKKFLFMQLFTTVPQRALMNHGPANNVYSMEKTLKNSHRLLSTMRLLHWLWVK